VRKLVIETEDKGRHGMRNVSKALHIIKAAVIHYKDLCEGLYCGEYVEPVRVIEGVAFHYCPPPRKSVPYAAGIKVKASRVVDEFGYEHERVPSRYKKEVVMDGNRLGDWEDIGVCGMEDVHGSRLVSDGDQCGNGCCDGNGDLRECKEGSHEEEITSKKEPVPTDHRHLSSHPDLGLFEVPCDSDYHPREEQLGRRLRRRKNDDGNHTQCYNKNPHHSQNANAPFFHHWNHTKAPFGTMPWTGMDMLRDATPTSLMNGYSSNPWKNPSEFDDVYDCRPRIPSLWEDMNGTGLLMQKTRQHQTRQHTMTNVFSSYEFRDERIPAEQEAVEDIADPSLDHVFTEFVEKCTVTGSGDWKRAEAKWRHTPTAHGVAPEIRDDKVDSNAKSRRKLDF
jgi:hypothetical protein